MQIQIDEKVVKLLKLSNISMKDMGSVCFILLAMYNDEIDLLDEVDDQNKEKSMLTLYKQMQFRGFLEQDSSGINLFHLTPTGEELAQMLMISTDKQIEIKVKTKDEQSEDPEMWIDDYIDLFPEGRPYGRPYRMGKSICLARMEKFLSKHKVDKKTILDSTKLWIDNYRNNEGFEKMRDSRYFIDKIIAGEHISDLETAIKMYQDNLENPTVNYNTKFMDII